MSDTTTGTVKATKTGSTIPVQIGDWVTTVQCARDLTPGTGDVVLIQKKGALWTAVARLFTAAPTLPPAPPVTPPVTPTSGTAVFSPVETRSYRSLGWRTDNTSIYQGQYGGNGNHTGCAFFGSAPRSLAGATVTGAWIAVRRNNSGGVTAAQGTTLWLMTNATRPAGAPTLTSSQAGPSLAWGQINNSFPIPASWGQAMVDGTAGGLAIFTSGGSPYVILSGVGDWGPAFTMTVNWRK
jgi:hypothetical protein